MRIRTTLSLSGFRIEYRMISLLTTAKAKTALFDQLYPPSRMYLTRASEGDGRIHRLTFGGGAGIKSVAIYTPYHALGRHGGITRGGYQARPFVGRVESRPLSRCDVYPACQCYCEGLGSAKIGKFGGSRTASHLLPYTRLIIEHLC